MAPKTIRELLNDPKKLCNLENDQTSRIFKVGRREDLY